MAGKGDKRRPMSISKKKYGERHDAIFKHPKRRNLKKKKRR